MYVNSILMIIHWQKGISSGVGSDLKILIFEN